MPFDEHFCIDATGIRQADNTSCQPTRVREIEAQSRDVASVGDFGASVSVMREAPLGRGYLGVFRQYRSHQGVGNQVTMTVSRKIEPSVLLQFVVGQQSLLCAKRAGRLNGFRNDKPDMGFTVR